MYLQIPLKMNVLLADHHPIFRRGIKSLMKDSKRLRFNGKVEDGEMLLEGIKEHKPELLILEIDLPNSNGAGALRDIRAHFPDLKVLIVSCHPEEIYAISAIKAGANGYIAKTKSSKEIKKAIETVISGETFLSDSIKEVMNSKSKTGKSVTLRYKKLSAREIEVLNLLSRGKRNKEISQILSINEKTVSTYKTRLLKKLNVDNIADLIHQSRLLQITS
ncbi:DNA-binding response regulator, LuxR family [Flavobacteria bacterium BBFL7]|nr:DNA-binding response regulator, LuxR family [Flavobacteria bacterium BBFL7]